MKLDSRDDDIFHPEPIPRKRIPAGKALLCIAVALLVGCMLDADGLRHTAERQQPGTTRTVALWMVRNVVQPPSHALGLNLPREWAADALGVKEGDTITSTKEVKLAPQSPTPTSSARQPGATTTTTAPPRHRTPTPQDPLRVLVAGDSLSENLYPALNQVLAGQPVSITEDSQVGTGLARPDVTDWPTRLAADMQKYHPEVAVLMFGGNDDQSLRTPTGWVSYTDLPAWQVEYEKRIALVMNTILGANPDATIFWVGLPSMRKAHLEQFRPLINSLIQREAAARPKNVVYVDSSKVLDGPGGAFQPYAVNPDGSQVRVREPDGVHMTVSGAARIAQQEILPVLNAQRNVS